MIPARAAAAAARPGRRPARPAPAYDSLSLSPSHGSPGPGRGSGLSGRRGRGIWLHLVARCELEDTVLIRALVHWQRSGSGLATKKQDFSSWPCLPPSLGHRFGAGPGPARAGGRAPAARVRVRGVRVPRAGGCRPLCGQRLPFHSKIPQLCFGFTILLISVIHTVGTWIGLRQYLD